jgi:carbonic anhydrase
MSCHHAAPPAHSRRRFLQTIALGGGAILFSTLPPTGARAGQAAALLLTCMDYRLTDETVAYMDGRGLHDSYDHVVLAGASLGALTDKYPEWGKAFRDHVAIAKALHHIHKVIVIDHRDCGAYKTFLGEAAVKDLATETATHATYLRRLRDAIKADHPDLEVELGIMGLDGKVEAVS